MNNLGPQNAAGVIAVATGCPIVAVLCFIGELYGFSDEINKAIDRIVKFYGYDEIVGRK